MTTEMPCQEAATSDSSLTGITLRVATGVAPGSYRRVTFEVAGEVRLIIEASAGSDFRHWSAGQQQVSRRLDPTANDVGMWAHTKAGREAANEMRLGALQIVSGLSQTQ